MSGPDALSVHAHLELGEDSVTFEFHYPASEVGILTAGFKVGTHRYRLARMGYMLATLRGEVETLELVFEGEDGTRHLLSLRTKNPSDTFVQIHEHVKAQTTPEPDTAI